MTALAPVPLREATRLSPHLEVKPATLWRVLGRRRPDQSVRPTTEALVGRAVELAASLAAPAAIGRVCTPAELAALELPAAHAAGAAWVGVGVATIGAALERAASELHRDGQAALATVLDAWGSLAAEAVAQQADLLLRRAMAAAGFRARPRRSPGFGPWALAAQPALLAVAQAQEIGVTAGPTFLMTPVKSVSFALGFEPAEGPVACEDEGPVCEHCELAAAAGCPYDSR